jgi:anti-anti-sigma factor
MAAQKPENDLFEKRASVRSGLIDDFSNIGYLSSVGSPMSETSKRVTKTDSIAVGEVEGSRWVRVQGKGNFMSSPRLKEYVEECLESKECETVVVDLDTCPAMDSTFMGTLAGLAGKLIEREGTLSVVGLSERNRDSLVDLGLDAILEMEKEDGVSPWSDNIQSIREGLTNWDGKQSGAAAAEEVLDAHRKLCQVDDRNNAKFSAVLDVLEKECSAKKAG